MALDIHRQRLILVLGLARPLGQMHMHHPLSQRTLDIKLEAQMLRTPPVRLLSTADIPIARPPRPRRFAVRCDFRSWAQQFLAARVGADEAGCAVEIGGFGRRAEDVGEEEVAYPGL